LTLRHQPGIIRYFGSFTTYNDETQEYSYSIMLEHAEEGDLEEFFADHSPPTNPDEIATFWKSLFEVAKALKRLHDLKISDQEYTG
jgi:serine/threonine protein kinase